MGNEAVVVPVAADNLAWQAKKVTMVKSWESRDGSVRRAKSWHRAGLYFSRLRGTEYGVPLTTQTKARVEFPFGTNARFDGNKDTTWATRSDCGL